jgi:hypothetical protein
VSALGVSHLDLERNCVLLVRNSPHHRREVHSNESLAGEELWGHQEGRPVVKLMHVRLLGVAGSILGPEGVTDGVELFDEPLRKEIPFDDDQNFQVGDVRAERK